MPVDRPGINELLPVRPCTVTRNRWRRLLTTMGPNWTPLKKRLHHRTVWALKRHGLIEYKSGYHLVMVRLTPRGVAVRDRWLELDAWRLDKRMKRKYPGRENRRPKIQI